MHHIVKMMRHSLLIEFVSIVGMNNILVEILVENLRHSKYCCYLKIVDNVFTNKAATTKGIIPDSIITLMM